MYTVHDGTTSNQNAQRLCQTRLTPARAKLVLVAVTATAWVIATGMRRASNDRSESEMAATIVHTPTIVVTMVAATAPAHWRGPTAANASGAMAWNSTTASAVSSPKRARVKPTFWADW